MRKSPRFHVIVALCAALGLNAAARADETIVVQQKYDLEGRFELMLTPSLSAFDKYTQHYAVSAGAAYYFLDSLGIEIDGGYAYIHGDRKLLNEILRTATNLDGIQRLPLTDLKYMTWWANAGLVFSPLYGKLNLSAELAFSFHFYVVAGAGVANYRYHELGNSLPTGGYEKREVDVGVKPSYYFGGGFRLHLHDDWSLRVEIRDQFFYDEYTAQHKPVGTQVVDKEITDFVHIVMVRLGVCYAF